MNIRKMERSDIPSIASLVAMFRVELNSYKNISSRPDISAGTVELTEYYESGFPIYIAEINGEYVGYIVCRVDEPCVWVESIYVSEVHRRSGIASQLYCKAQEIARSYGEETVYNYVHPNNHGMIRFLRKHGYTVLNLLEIRKPYEGETFTQVINIDKHEFDY